MSVLPTALLSSSSSSPVHIVHIAVWLSFSSHYCTSDLWEHVSECEYCVVDSGRLTLNKQTAVRPLKSDVTAEHRSRDRTCSWALCLYAWWKSYHARLLIHSLLFSGLWDRGEMHLFCCMQSSLKKLNFLFLFSVLRLSAGLTAHWWALGPVSSVSWWVFLSARDKLIQQKLVLTNSTSEEVYFAYFHPC